MFSLGALRGLSIECLQERDKNLYEKQERILEVHRRTEQGIEVERSKQGIKNAYISLNW
jgi:hypothetical protein